jgi:hypothetical protein
MKNARGLSPANLLNTPEKQEENGDEAALSQVAILNHQLNDRPKKEAAKSIRSFDWL